MKEEDGKKLQFYKEGCNAEGSEACEDININNPWIYKKLLKYIKHELKIDIIIISLAPNFDLFHNAAYIKYLIIFHIYSS